MWLPPCMTSLCVSVFLLLEVCESNLPGSRQTASLPSFRTLSAKIPCLSLLPSLCRSLWDGLVRLSLSEFEVFWGGVRSSVSVPPRASSVLFAGVAGVASLLCVNSALIQKLFYAVKGTCDRQRGVEGGEEWGGRGGWVGGGQGNNFLVTCPIGHIQNNSSIFVHDIYCP